MSYTITRSITCDTCLDWFDGGNPLATASQIRRAAKRRGWRVALPGGVDVCPECPTAPTSESE